jgi:hypothetical protein
LAHPIFSLSRKGAFFILVLSGLLVLLLAVLSLLVRAAHAGEVTVAWDSNPEPEVAGYKIYYGTHSGSYTSSVDAGNTTNILLSGLQDGATYFFAAVAYDASNNESGYSNEITYAVPAAASPPPASPPVVGEASSGGGGACFIATAAFGSYRAPEVILLQKFRDRILLASAPGRLFVEFYYRVSPPIADFIGHYDSLKRATRLALKPLIFSIQHRLAVYMGVLTLLLAMTFILVFEQRRLMREVRHIRR